MKGKTTFGHRSPAPSLVAPSGTTSGSNQPVTPQAVIGAFAILFGMVLAGSFVVALAQGIWKIAFDDTPPRDSVADYRAHKQAVDEFCAPYADAKRCRAKGYMMYGR